MPRHARLVVVPDEFVSRNTRRNAYYVALIGAPVLAAASTIAAVLVPDNAAMLVAVFGALSSAIATITGGLGVAHLNPKPDAESVVTWEV